MKVVKYGHCCLKVVDKGSILLIDPGSYSIDTNPVNENIDAIFVSHEHPDHLHLDSVKKIIKRNPNVVVYTGQSVGKILNDNDVDFINISDIEDIKVKSLNLRFIHGKHAEIYKTVNLVENIGIVVNERLYFPGDNFLECNSKFDTLALPVSGPWMKLSESIDFALKVNPKLVIPVHDGMLRFLGSAHTLTESVLKMSGIDFLVLELGKEADI